MQQPTAVTCVLRQYEGSIIGLFPYICTGKKGLIKAYYNGSIIDVNYSYVMKNSKRSELYDENRCKRELESVGIYTRCIAAARRTYGIMEKLFVGRVMNGECFSLSTL